MPLCELTLGPPLELLTPSLPVCSQARIPAIVFCLSHNSALVKTLSTSLLRQVLALDSKLPAQLLPSPCNDCQWLSGLSACVDPTQPGWGQPQGVDGQALGVPPLAHPGHTQGTLALQQMVQQCIFWEVEHREAKGLCTAPLAMAASALGCPTAS